MKWAKHLKIAIWIAAGGLIMSAGESYAGDARLDEIFRDYWEVQMENYPTWATYLGDYRYNDRLTDYSAQEYANRMEQDRSFLSRIDGVPLDGLSPADSLNHMLFRRQMVDALEGAAYDGYLMPITQQGGPPNGFAELPSSHPMQSYRDVETYIERLRAFPALVDQVMANMAEGMERGLMPARITMEKVLPQYEALITEGPADHVLAGVVDNLPEDLSAAEALVLESQILSAIGDQVIPSYRKLRDYIRDRYVDACRTDHGIWSLPDGQSRYAYLVRHYTTTDMSPQEIHDTGKRVLDEIKTEMRQITDALQYEGTLADFMESLRTNPTYYYTTPEELMEGFRTICRRMDERLDSLFGRLPRQWYDLKEMEAFRAPAAPAAYYYGAPDDGSRPGYFYVNTYKPETRPKYTMEALAYHEAVPGHHLQLTIQQELEGLPDFRRHGGFTAFVEGWGLYAELLPKEVGLYADPYSDFGRLTYQAWRAVRLIVDTGIHEFKWTREDAIEFFKENTALSEVNIISEVERYIATPGQALAYMIGRLKIQDIRRGVERTLGDRFDIRAFHDALLEEGALPLDLLEIKMDRWLAAQETPSNAR
jgi:prolyl oligopeptidase